LISKDDLEAKTESEILASEIVVYEKIPLGKLRRRRDDNIRMDLRNVCMCGRHL
jgi:hypothetical protein